MDICHAFVVVIRNDLHTTLLKQFPSQLMLLLYPVKLVLTELLYLTLSPKLAIQTYNIFAMTLNCTKYNFIKYFIVQTKFTD